MKWFSKTTQFLRVATFEFTDEGAFDSGLANLKEKAPDILGYAGARIKIVKTGPAKGILIAEMKNKEALNSYISMTADLFEEQAAKFGMKLEPQDGEVVWES